MRAMVLVAWLGAVAACDPGDGPHIESIAPTAAPAGARVVISGARFCGSDVVVVDGACQPLPVGYVSFGIDPQIDGTPTAWRDDQIEVTVPNGAQGDVLVVLTVDGRSSNGVWFEVQ